MQLAPTINGAIIPGDIYLNNNAQIQYNNSNSQTLSGDISGPGLLSKWSGGTLKLSGSNTFEGVTSINAGVIKLGHANALGTPNGVTQLRRFNDANRGRVELNGFSTDETFSFEDTNSGNTGSYIGYGGLIENNNPLVAAECSGTITLNKHGTVQGSGDITLSGTISGSGSLFKKGTNTLTISGANTYTNQTVLGSGTLRLGADNTLPAESTVILWNATLDAGGFSNTGAALKVRGNGTLALEAGAQLSFGNSRDQNWGGTLAITGTLRSRSLHFTGGLTAAQLSSITYNGNRVYLTTSGYVIGDPPATLMIVR